MQNIFAAHKIMSLNDSNDEFAIKRINGFLLLDTMYREYQIYFTKYFESILN